ncbi:uncharacterized protein BO87DRAFT_204435 [Aspergillus neoniger CBS 115656]|uniref:Uncharacterized protein n=1 Tax=Aspergillus neoniger (strain CBS 115656) TaxID=1448310 RepID=A0A318ZN09_ASPNB|nr:hypothetical protein BO87DRAFT_204435 [Aspergillus neoniger CBS 115656]PYH37252.1 hypothetical protein BO87DRAFT_204435 [Aspergillus neoniger CBS 115656]
MSQCNTETLIARLLLKPRDRRCWKHPNYTQPQPGESEKEFKITEVDVLFRYICTRHSWGRPTLLGPAISLARDWSTWTTFTGSITTSLEVKQLCCFTSIDVVLLPSASLLLLPISIDAN